MIEEKKAFTSKAFLTKYRYDNKSGTVILTLLLKRKPTEKQRRQLTSRTTQDFTVIAWETEEE